MPPGSVYRIKQLLAGSLKGSGKKDWPDGTKGNVVVPPHQFSVLQQAASSVEPPEVESTAGRNLRTPSSSALADIVATLDTCITLEVPSKPFFWHSPSSS